MIAPRNRGVGEKSLESIVYLVEKDEAAPTIEGHRFDFLLKDFFRRYFAKSAFIEASPLKLEIKVEGDIRFPFLRGMAVKLAVDAAEAESIMKIK